VVTGHVEAIFSRPYLSNGRTIGMVIVRPSVCPSSSLSLNRQHYEIDDCLEDNREDYYNYHYVNYICTRIMEFLQF